MKLHAFYFYASILIVAFTGCSKENNIPVNIGDVTGIWFEEDSLVEYHRISRVEYNFKENDSIEILRIELDINTREVLGYRFRVLGKYIFEGDQLTFIDQVSYGNDDTKGPYSEIENLQLVTNDQGISYTITCKFDNYGKKLVFIYPPCGELANCIGSKTLLKAK